MSEIKYSTMTTENEMKRGTWWHHLTATDKATLEAWAEWLRPIPWQWMVTATFPWAVTAETADSKLGAWVNGIERTLRSRLCMVGGREKKPADFVGWHYHLLLASRVALPQDVLVGYWQKIVGKGQQRMINGNLVDDGIQVEQYDSNLPGIGYSLKSIYADGEWKERWLRFFHPAIKGPSNPSHGYARQVRRFEIAAEQVRIAA